MNCKHCEYPNNENWFYCKNCGERASSPKFTSTMFMRNESSKRTDIEFSTTTLDAHISKIQKDKQLKDSSMWKKRIKQASMN